MRHTFASKVASLFRELLDYNEDVETEWDLLKSTVITPATASCGCKCVEGQMGSEKKTAWWNQEVKEANMQRKLCLQLGKQKSHLSSFDWSTLQYIRLLPLFSNSLKKIHGKNLHKSWIQTIDR